MLSPTAVVNTERDKKNLSLRFSSRLRTVGSSICNRRWCEANDLWQSGRGIIAKTLAREDQKKHDGVESHLHGRLHILGNTFSQRFPTLAGRYVDVVFKRRKVGRSVTASTKGPLMKISSGHVNCEKGFLVYERKSSVINTDSCSVTHDEPTMARERTN